MLTPATIFLFSLDAIIIIQMILFAIREYTIGRSLNTKFVTFVTLVQIGTFMMIFSEAESLSPIIFNNLFENLFLTNFGFMLAVTCYLMFLYLRSEVLIPDDRFKTFLKVLIGICGVLLVGNVLLSFEFLAFAKPERFIGLIIVALSIIVGLIIIFIELYLIKVFMVHLNDIKQAFVDFKSFYATENVSHTAIVVWYGLCCIGSNFMALLLFIVQIFAGHGDGYVVVSILKLIFVYFTSVFLLVMQMRLVNLNTHKSGVTTVSGQGHKRSIISTGVLNPV